MKVTRTANETKNVITVSFELTEREIQILQHVKEEGYIQFRISYDTKEDRLDDSGKFKKSEIQHLVEHDFLEHDTESWHSSYNLGEMAKI